MTQFDLDRVDAAFHELIAYIKAECDAAGYKGYWNVFVIGGSHDKKAKFSIHGQSAMGNVENSPTIKGTVEEFLRRMNWSREQEFKQLPDAGAKQIDNKKVEDDQPF